jgi:hypothetical protein
VSENSTLIMTSFHLNLSVKASPKTQLLAWL